MRDGAYPHHSESVLKRDIFVHLLLIHLMAESETENLPNRLYGKEKIGWDIVCKHKCQGSESEKATGLHPLIRCLWTGGAKLMRVRAPGPNHCCSASRNSLFFLATKMPPSSSLGKAWCIHWAKRRPWIGTRPPWRLATSRRRVWRAWLRARGATTWGGASLPSYQKANLTTYNWHQFTPKNCFSFIKYLGGKLPMILDLWIQSHWL